MSAKRQKKKTLAFLGTRRPCDSHGCEKEVTVAVYWGKRRPVQACKGHAVAAARAAVKKGVHFVITPLMTPEPAVEAAGAGP
jgi:hypothetical protein